MLKGEYCKFHFSNGNSRIWSLAADSGKLLGLQFMELLAPLADVSDSMTESAWIQLTTHGLFTSTQT